MSGEGYLPNCPLQGQPATLQGPDGERHILPPFQLEIPPARFSEEPGRVGDASGAINVRPGQRLMAGTVYIPADELERAARHGWEPVQDADGLRARFGDLVQVKRPWR